ncbi:MAG: hydrogenase subunit MbhD domain-containing protein [Desulfurococcaceae archaeon]
MVAETIVYLIMATASLVSTIATYRAIKERDLLKAVIYSALQSGLYTILYYFLMAPDIVLVYLPVAVGLVPGVLIIIVSRTERWEKQ